MKTIFGLLLIGGVVASAAGMYYAKTGQRSTVTFRTALVERGTMLATISASGTLQPEDAIDVGAQVAGQIKQFGRDPSDPAKPIDFGSQVEEGTILAQLDDSVYASQVGHARATVLRADADLAQAKSKLRQTDRDWQRVRRMMGSKGVVSDLEYDAAQSAYEGAVAAVNVAEAALLQARESLKQAETNLSFTTIRSPVKGVILDRRVNVGQTVVASLNAPSLFLIATDLKKLEIWASVNEADIGSIHKDQFVRFSVDAFPGESFTGKVAQIRLNAAMTMNVVNYTVVVDTDNSSQRLLPYMTANLHFLVGENSNVLMVPNAALRWRPQRQYVAPDYHDEFDRAVRRKSSSSGDARAAERERQNQHYVWAMDAVDQVRPIKVRIGLTDGNMTEIITDELAEGDTVVIGAVTTTPEGAVNPFAPVVPTRR
jgi:HlyD family secretion protein